MNDSSGPQREQDARGERANTRTCVGCGARVPRADADEAMLVRLVVGPDGTIAVDAANGGFGRGAHLHAARSCIEKAARAGLPRAAKRGDLSVCTDVGALVPLTPTALATAMRDAAVRRIGGLLGAAKRAKAVALGSDAVVAALRNDDAALVVVATDAAAAADLGPVRGAIADGRAVAFGTKESLSAALHAAGLLAVLAITSATIAAEIRACVRMADACQAAPLAGAGQPGARVSNSKGPTGGSQSPSPAVRGNGATLERGA